MEKTTATNTPDVTPNVTPNKGERRKQKSKFTPNKEELRNRKEVATKYSGLYTEVLKNGDISFVGRWRCPRNKTKAIRLGRKSKGMTPEPAYALRLNMMDQEKKEFIKTLGEIHEPTEAPPSETDSI